jgi:hypothetical protein
MTITNNVVAKLSVAFVAAALALSLVAPMAQAADASEMSLDELIALVNQLQAQAGQTDDSTSTGGSCVSIPAPLTMGSTGANVTALQNALIAAGQSIPAGATGYFGAQTQSALAAWQTANGVSPAVGYYGPITQAAWDAKCVPADGDDDATDDEDEDSSEDEDMEMSGEASLDDVTINDGDDTDLEEGQEDAPVAEVDVEFADGDAMITRLDVSFVGSGDEQDPWDTFEEVSLWVDGDEVARMAADDEDEYLDENDGSLRFSGLDIMAMEDEEITITVGVTVQDSVDGTNNGEAWTFDADAIRFVDADDVSSTEDNVGDLGGSDQVSFDIEEEGGDDELIIKTSTEDPDATTLTVETNQKSDWYTIFAYDLDSDDSTNDLEINNIVVGLQTNDLIADVVSDVKLVIDGEEYDDFSYLAADPLAGVSAAYDFDIDGDLVIDAGDRVTVEVQVEFKQLSAYPEGTTISASSTATSYDVEGADDVTAEGSATGDTHTLRTQGAILEFVSATETKDANGDSSTTDDEGVFVLKFDVTAFEADLYVNKSAASGTASSSAGVNYRITDGSGIAKGTTTPSGSLASTADTEGTRFVVREGETETFTLTVTIDPGVSGFHGLQLYSFNYRPEVEGDPTVKQRALPAADFETDPLSI